MSDAFEPAGVDLDKATTHVASVFMHGLRQIGAKSRADDEIWFLKPAWGHVVDVVNSLTDGDYSAKEISAKCRAAYLEATNQTGTALLPGEMVVWEAVARCLFEVIEEGQILPEFNTEGWDRWIAEHLAGEKVNANA